MTTGPARSERRQGPEAAVSGSADWLLAFEMWQRSFSGQNLFGFGAAISTFLFLLFIPFLVVNIRRFKAETT